jgi:hypothetical protein
MSRAVIRLLSEGDRGFGPLHARHAWRPFLRQAFRWWHPFEAPREATATQSEQALGALRDLEGAMSALQVRVEALPAPAPPELASTIGLLARSVA